MNQRHKFIRNLKKIKIVKMFNPEMVSHQPRTIVLHEYQAIYFRIPKVANSSWSRVCAILLNIDIPQVAIANDSRVDGLPTLDKEEILKHKDYFKFGFVRNPYDRLVSLYHNKLKQDATINTKYMRNGVHNCLAKFKVFKAGMSLYFSH